MYSCVVAVAISSAALQLDDNQTDSFTFNGGLHKATTWANLQQERLWNVVTNTADSSDRFITTTAVSNVA